MIGILEFTSYFTHEFDAPIEEFGVGRTKKVWYRVVFMPAALESQLPFDRYPRLRIDGEISDVPISNAFIPTGDGRRYLIVSPKVLRDAGVTLGDEVSVRFRVADQDHVDVPDALVRALSNDRSASAAWDALTPGKRRAMAHRVAGAKTQPTIKRRVVEVLESLKTPK